MPFEPDSLKDYLTPDGPERVGFLLETGEVVEVKNICVDPINGFEVSGADLLKYEDTAVASWHTHPGDTYDANLTEADRQSFLAYPNMCHYIVAQDGVRCYAVKDEKVVIAP
jgi:proteasome lid subunit RPN8/RPN11